MSPARGSAAGAALGCALVLLVADLAALASGAGADPLADLARALPTLLACGLGAGTLCASVVLLLGACARAVRLLVGLLLPATLLVLLLLPLLSGAWIASQWWVWILRPLTGAVALGAPILCARALRWLAVRGPARGTLMAWSVAALCVALDSRLFVRRYPSFHLLLVLASLAAGAAGGWLLSLRSRVRGLPVILAAGLVGGLLVATRVLPGDDHVRALLVSRAPLSGRLLALLPAPREGAADAWALDAWRRRPACDPARLDALLPGRRRFDVVLVTIDTLRADHVTHLGYGRTTTPELDALGRAGVTFTSAYAQSCTSKPSLSSMFRGRYPTAVKQEGSTLAGMLAAAGHRSIAWSALPDGQLRILFRFLPAGFERFNDPRHAQELEAGAVVTRALDEIAKPADRPLFLWVHLFDPHAPYRQRKERHFGAAAIDRYDSEIAAADAALGRLLRGLQASPHGRRTVVVVHGDHGEEFLDHGARYHNSSLYEEQVHVPLVIRLPGGPARRVEQPVELVDLVPTLLEILGQPLPGNVHGHSLLPLLLPEAAPQGARPPPLAYMQFRWGGLPPTALDAVREGRWKLIRDLRAGTDRLFDLDTDPGERRNVAAREPQALARLTALARAAREIARGAAPAIAGRDELLDRASRGPVPERLEAARLLVQRGAIDAACRAVADLAASDAPVVQRVAAIDLLRLRGDPRFIPLLQGLLKEPSPDLRRAAVLSLATMGAGVDRDLVFGRWADDDRSVSHAARVALAVLGDKPAARELASTDWGGDDRLLQLFRGAGDLAPGLPALSVLLQASDLEPPDFAVLLASVRQHRSAQALVAVMPWVREGWWQEYQLDGLLEAFGELGSAATMPLLRLGLAHRSREQRARVRALLAARGAADRVGPMNATNEALRSVAELFRQQQRPDPSSVIELLSPLLEGSAALDWAARHDAWRAFVATGSYDLAGRMLALEGAPGDPVDAWLRGRLRRLQDALSGPGSAVLAFPARAPRVRRGQESVALLVNISVPEGARALTGGLPFGNARLVAALWVAGEPRPRPVIQHPLPECGLLPGEEAQIVAVLPLPGDLPAGAATLTLTVVTRMPPGPVGAPASVTLRVR